MVVVGIEYSVCYRYIVVEWQTDGGGGGKCIVCSIIDVVYSIDV